MSLSDKPRHLWTRKEKEDFIKKGLTTDDQGNTLPLEVQNELNEMRKKGRNHEKNTNA